MLVLKSVIIDISRATARTPPRTADPQARAWRSIWSPFRLAADLPPVAKPVCVVWLLTHRTIVWRNY